jgi:hypothetical protein
MSHWALSKYLKLPVRTLTAPTLKRVWRALMRSKSTRLSNVERKWLVSYQLVDSAMPSGWKKGGIMRG